MVITHVMTMSAIEEETTPPASPSIPDSEPDDQVPESPLPESPLPESLIVDDRRINDTEAFQHFLDKNLEAFLACRCDDENVFERMLRVSALSPVSFSMNRLFLLAYMYTEYPQRVRVTNRFEWIVCEKLRLTSQYPFPLAYAPANTAAKAEIELILGRQELQDAMGGRSVNALKLNDREKRYLQDIESYEF